MWLPTLFRFLEQAGVALPAAPGDQRRLYEGERDSLLAKYAARFADRTAAFWRNLLSPELAQSRLIGDAYLKANVQNLGIDHDLRAYDFTVQAIQLNQAQEGAETAVAFFLSLVSSILDKPVLDRTVVLGEMSVQGLLLKVNALPERMQLAVEAGARRILIPSDNKRDVAEVPDAILTATQWQFFDSPTRAAIMALGMG